LQHKARTIWLATRTSPNEPKVAGFSTRFSPFSPMCSKLAGKNQEKLGKSFTKMFGSVKNTAL
jgi:hypothetical protein